MPILIRIAIPAVTGGLLGVLAIGGLVWSQNAVSGTNPASQSALTYGDR